jgi:hypothetical protein
MKLVHFCSNYDYLYFIGYLTISCNDSTSHIWFLLLSLRIILMLCLNGRAFIIYMCNDWRIPQIIYTYTYTYTFSVCLPYVTIITVSRDYDSCCRIFMINCIFYNMYWINTYIWINLHDIYVYDKCRFIYIHMNTNMHICVYTYIWKYVHTYICIYESLFLSI